MRKSSRRKRPPAERRDRSGNEPRPGGTDKRERQADARRTRERMRQRARVRRSFGGNAAILVGVAVVSLIVIQLIRSSGGKTIPAPAIEAAHAAGCGDVQTPESDPVGGHLSPGQTYNYPNEPATSGPHDQTPLPSDPHVYTTPVQETNAVHNLEHAYVLIYYRAEAPDSLPTAVLQHLATLANGQDKVIMAPHPNLPEGTALALAAWNKLWECPASVTSEQATTIASGFVEAYRGSGDAPEPQAP